MLVAIKLLLFIAVLCYGVSLVLAEQNSNIAFQAPLTHQFLTNKYGGASSSVAGSNAQGDDLLRPKVSKLKRCRPRRRLGI